MFFFQSWDKLVTPDAQESQGKVGRVQKRAGWCGPQSLAEQDFEKLEWVSLERDPHTRIQGKQCPWGLIPGGTGRE